MHLCRGGDALVYGPHNGTHVVQEIDASGRRYLVDASGTRILSRSRRPPIVSGKVWGKLTPDEQEAWLQEYRDILKRAASRPKDSADISLKGSSSDKFAVPATCPMGVHALLAIGIDHPNRHNMTSTFRRGAPVMPTESRSPIHI